MLEPRRAVKDLHAYKPPLAGRQGLRLDFNESTIGCSPRVLEKLRSLDAEALARYPEREPVERVVADFLGLDPTQVLLTNGVDEGIHLLCSTYIDPGNEAIITAPTFAMYEIFAAAEDARAITVCAGENFSFPLDEILQRINECTRLIAVASPNNPTGTVVSPDVLVQIAKAAPHAALMVDEAYFEFHGESVIDYVKQDSAKHVPNLFVARTFSKAFGLAGLRIGILAGNADQMKLVRRVASPYNVNAAALAILPNALADWEYVDRYAAEVRRNRGVLQKELGTIGLHYWPSHANFVLVKIGSSHAEFVKALRARGILVRDRNSDPGCEGCVRLTVGSDEHTQILIRELRQVADELGLRREVRA